MPNTWAHTEKLHNFLTHNSPLSRPEWRIPLINFYRSIIIRILRCAAVKYFFLHTIRFRFGCCWSEIITNNLILPFFYIYCVHISHEERHKQLQIRRESNSTWIDEKWTQVPHWFQLRDGTITFKRLFYKSRSTPQGPVN